MKYFQLTSCHHNIVLPFEGVVCSKINVAGMQGAVHSVLPQSPHILKNCENENENRESEKLREKKLFVSFISSYINT